MVSPARYIFILFLMMTIGAEGVKFTEKDNFILRALKEEMSNQIQNDTQEMSIQTKNDTLNLPANASSIRENITDTFSCENRTYGYYADVDNDCQLFHVCVPTKTPSAKNITYRYSFICPSETVFNQVVLTCTRPIDSVPCEESPNFYYLNEEIGKETNKTTENDKKEDKKLQKRKNRKENIVMESFIKNDIKGKIKEKLEEYGNLNKDETSPILIDTVIENLEFSSQEDKEREEEMDRMIMERNMRQARQMRRGSIRFKGDV